MSSYYPMSSAAAYASSFATGVILHIAAFRIGEWDMYTLALIITTLALGLTLSLASYLVQPADMVSYWTAIKTGFSLVGALAAGVYSSMLVYRASPFHRLHRFPGPFGARLSNFWMTRRSIKKFHVFEEVQDLHRRYGDIVRVGPSELSIADPKAFEAIYGTNTVCKKGPWYEILRPMVSLHMVRDRKDHAPRRRVWDRGFSAQALRNYAGRVTKYTSQLLQNIDRMVADGQTVDASQWFNFYSFDIMGDMAFGKSFDMLKEGVVHYYLASSHSNMSLIGAFSRLIWLFPVFKGVPGLNYEHVRFQKWLRTQVHERLKNEPEVPDVFSWLAEDFRKNARPTWQQWQDLYGDATLIVIAGSDTATATLTCLFYQLALQPDICKKLQGEIDDFFNALGNANGNEEKPDPNALSKLKYLQACIDESLRLWPPVASGLQRLTPPEGLTFGNTWIPGNTIVQAPSWTMHRDPRCFEHPDEFIPERWTTKPELCPDASVYVPFSTGRTSCVGKQLGLMEVREVTTRILRKYEISLAPGQNPDSFLDGLVDAFTLSTPKLDLKFSLRKTGL